MKNILFILLLLLPQEKTALDKGLDEITVDVLKKHEKFLASDDLEGRCTGYPGNDKAAEYIAAEFKDLGLAAAGSEGYTQPFTVGKDKKTRNVLALLEGSDAKLKEETVVIGAHFDHVGKDGQTNFGRGKSGGEDKIWNGADDNASGTTCVLAIARAFVKSGVKQKRSILFALWSGEEAGLVGSSWWCNHPTRPIDKVVFNLNLDMVGRNPDRPVDLEGLKDAEGDTIAKLAMKACDDEKLAYTPYDFQNEAMFRSDGASFLRKKIPAIMFFTYWHDDYHGPGDHWDKIAYERMAKIARASMRILVAVADLERVPAFNADTPLNDNTPRLGINGEAVDAKDLATLKLADGQGAFKITQVVDGSVAAAAGIKLDDLLIAFDGKPLPAKNPLDGLRAALRKVKKGEEHEVEVIRGAERLKLKALWPK